MSFEELSHTADIKIRVHAHTLEKLFSDTFKALMQVCMENRSGRIPYEIEIESSDYESLLTDFLSEVLFVSEVESLVFSEARIRIDGFSLTAELRGELFDPVRHSGGSEVKGISYSGLAITHNEKGFMLDIIFDV
jgi:SHS2 domain-containing protein